MLLVETRSGAHYEISEPGPDGFSEITRDGKLFCRGKLIGSGKFTLEAGMTVDRPDEAALGFRLIIDRKDQPDDPWLSTIICKVQIV